MPAMKPLWMELLALHAMVGLSVILWSLLDTYMPAVSRSRIGPGMVLGLVGVMTMAMAVEVLPGIRIDLRHALIAAGGLVFGPVSGLITGAISSAVRISYGGAGVLAGLTGIASSTFLGGAANLALKGRIPDLQQCIVFAAVVGLGALTSLLLVPSEVRGTIFQQSWLPLLTLTFTSTLFTSYFFSIERARYVEFQNLSLYRKMVDALPDCLNVKDLDGRFIIANKATADLMKARDASDLIGKTDFDFYPHAVAAGYRDDETAVLKGTGAQRLEQMVDFKDGKIGWLETVKVPIRSEAGALTGLISYNRDITDIHASNELKAQFVSTISHEIRTPLTSICGSLRLIAEAFPDELPPKAVRLIAVADRNARHLNELIDNLLVSEKLDAGQTDFSPEILDMTRLAKDAVESMKHYLPHKDLSWAMSHSAEDTKIHVHPLRLQQVLLNLLSNAAKFSPAKGIIEVDILQIDGMVRLIVRDAGPGVQPDFEASLFSRFRQEEATARVNKAGGTGLGLSLAKSFVEHMSGSISYRRLNDKTEFCVEFPSLSDSHELKGHLAPNRLSASDPAFGAGAA
ncbi:PAS domain S-box-containing protein [Loktanella atrilutea]|uniref:histidine kinase n=1 Tax=Loktanella atrilutea TaxID=366533 RepID=A0A1M5F9D6_LOKAT|nr:ATP-binding protein [Loktanella atrilutea]SHF88145.1 PAS domain S-box-containing protein [Loktanella atrilutea]